MAAYEPVSRRPIAGAFRATASLPVRWCVRRGIHPDLVSYASVVAAVLAGMAFWQAAPRPWLLIPAVGFCYLRLWFNMLDGMVALAGGTASATGEIVNELPDRISDVIIFLGVAHSGLCHPLSGYGAALAALLVAYVGTLGQAVAGRREFGGIMSKPLRMVTLHAGAWLTLALIWWRGGRIAWAGHAVLDWTCYAILAGSAQTVWLRLARTVALLRDRSRAQGGSP